MTILGKCCIIIRVWFDLKIVTLVTKGGGFVNCLEAQTKIVAFIDDKLNDEETVEFVKHIRHCENCAEELEIYYTLLVGMKQLDNEESLSTDFKGDLDNKLNHEYNMIVNTKKVKISTLLGILIVIIGVGIIAYSNYIKFLYTTEQDLIKSSQPVYMYQEYFGDELFIIQEDKVLYSSSDTEKKDKGLLFYSKIRNYKISTDYNNEVNDEENSTN